MNTFFYLAQSRGSCSYKHTIPSCGTSVLVQRSKIPIRQGLIWGRREDTLPVKSEALNCVQEEVTLRMTLPLASLNRRARHACKVSRGRGRSLSFIPRL